MRVAGETADGADVHAIALSGTFHGICAVDRSMKPVTKLYSWNYTGSSAMCRQIRAREDLRNALYERTGCMPHNTYPRDTLAFLAGEGLDLKNKIFITQGGYNFYRLTGKFLESVSMQSGSGLINLKSRRYDPFVLEEYLGFTEDQLGDLVTYDETCPLSAQGAALLGLKSGIPVVPAHPDGALNQIGSRAGRPGRMTLSVETSAALRVVSEKPVLPESKALWCYCGVEGYLSGAATAGACNCVNWFVEDLLGGSLTYEELESPARGCGEPPVFLPFLYGERCPGWQDDRKGGFAQIGPHMGPADLYRALQMGILFNLLQCYQVLCRENGEPEQVLVSGGIAHSRRWLQMVCDIFQREIRAAAYPNASVMGAAVLGLHAAGALDRNTEFAPEAGGEIRIESDRNQYSWYQEQYEHYLSCYRQTH